jgi:hypothetical protein
MAARITIKSVNDELARLGHQARLAEHINGSPLIVTNSPS